MSFLRRWWRPIAGVLNLLVFSVGAFSLWAVGWPMSRELDAVEAFAAHAQQQVQLLRQAPPTPFACSRPLRSAHKGKAFFGAVDTVILFAPVKAAENVPTMSSPGPYFGAGQNWSGLDAIEYRRAHNQLWHNVQKLLDIPISEWRHLRGEATLHPGISTSRTDFGVAAVLDLAPRADGGVEGMLLVDVAAYPSGETVCRGALPFSAESSELAAASDAIVARLDQEARAWAAPQL